MYNKEMWLSEYPSVSPWERVRDICGDIDINTITLLFHTTERIGPFHPGFKSRPLSPLRGMDCASDEGK